MEFTLEDLGLKGEFEDKAKALEAFHAQFIAKELVPHDKELVGKLIGKRLGELSTLARREFSLQSSDIKEKSIEDVIKFASERGREALAEANKGRGADFESEEIDRLTGELGTMKTKATDLETDLFGANQKLQDQQLDFDSRLNGQKIETKLEAVKSAIPLRSDISDFERRGFDSAIGDFEWGLSEVGNLVVKKDGELIKNETQTGFVEPKDILTKLASENKLLALNNQNQKKKPNTQTPKIEIEEGKERAIHPALKKWSEKNNMRTRSDA